MFRDELLDEARRMLKSAGNDQDVIDDRIIDIENIVYDLPNAPTNR